MEMGWFVWPFLAIAVAAITWMVHKKTAAAKAAAGGAAAATSDGAAGTGA